MTDLFTHVGSQIREQRNKYGYGGGVSQEVVAKAIGVTPNTISRWETATYRPSLEDLDKLARFFGVSILSFFPSDETAPNSKIDALLRAAKQLPDEDIDELQRYASFRRARSLYAGGGKRKPGRQPKGAR
jgi:transcriptional regulator with XRE-family HTH domain